jgi:hypothetical protein
LYVDGLPPIHGRPASKVVNLPLCRRPTSSVVVIIFLIIIVYVTIIIIIHPLSLQSF